MEGIIVNFRGGLKTKKGNQLVVKPEGITNRKEAEKLLNKTVIWQTPAGNKIKGTVSRLHGNSGALRVQFEKGMPGQSLGTKVEIQ